jgi:hypothetical protein
MCFNDIEVNHLRVRRWQVIDKPVFRDEQGHSASWSMKSMRLG